MDLNGRVVFIMLNCSILNKYVNEIDYRNENIYEAIWYELGFIPNRFHREFLQEAIEDLRYQDPWTVHKIGGYFLDAIWEDMTEDEQNGDFWCDIGCIGKMSDYYNKNYINLNGISEVLL